MNHSAVVSVCMPIYKGDPVLVKRAIQSVVQQTYPHFELLVALDEDDSPLYPVLSQCYRADPRIRLVNQGRRGLTATRNHLLALATGSVLAFLDADNVWNPQYLEKVVQLYASNPLAQCAYCALQYQTMGQILFKPFDLEELHRGNYIDMNVFSFRRSLYAQYGGFDETLTRLVDWDLVLKYAQHTTPVAFDYVGTVYNDDPEDTRYRVTRNEGYNHNHYRITHKHKHKLPARPGQLSRAATQQQAKVLYVMYHYCQITETYIDWEMRYVEQLGYEVRVMVFEQRRGHATPHHKHVYSDLHEAMTDFQPDWVHVHWLQFVPAVTAYLDQHRITHVPVTVRLHGFEYRPDSMVAICSHPCVQWVLAYPHTPRAFPCSDKLLSARIPICPDIHYPAALWRPPATATSTTATQTPIRVLRIGACLPTKDLHTFIDVAAALAADDRFVFHLVLGTAAFREEMVDTMRAYWEAKGRPCLWSTNVPRDEVGDLYRASHVYLHTTSNQCPYGQPISIAEAMACGHYVIAKEPTPTSTCARDYISDCGTTYHTPQEAIDALLAVAQWSEEQWTAARARSIQYAYSLFVPEVVYRHVTFPYQAQDATTQDATTQNAMT